MAPMLDTFTYMAVVFLILVKAAEFVCLVGLGFGLSFSAWLLHRIYGKYSKSNQLQDGASGSDELEDGKPKSSKQNLVVRRRNRKKPVKPEVELLHCLYCNMQYRVALSS